MGERLLLEPHVGVEIIWVVSMDSWPSQSAMTLRSTPLRNISIAVECRLCLRRDRRHTAAVHLLRSGVDVNTIRAWLGHVSVETTNRYAEVDLEMKAKTIAMCAVTPEKGRTDQGPLWRKDPDLMAFLDSL